MNNKEDTVTISKEEYEELLADRKILKVLRAAGVDNWEGWDYSLQLMMEEDE